MTQKVPVQHKPFRTDRRLLVGDQERRESEVATCDLRYQRRPLWANRQVLWPPGPNLPPLPNSFRRQLPPLRRHKTRPAKKEFNYSIWWLYFAWVQYSVFPYLFWFAAPLVFKEYFGGILLMKWRNFQYLAAPLDFFRVPRLGTTAVTEREVTKFPSWNKASTNKPNEIRKKIMTHCPLSYKNGKVQFVFIRDSDFFRGKPETRNENKVFHLQIVFFFSNLFFLWNIYLVVCFRLLFISKESNEWIIFKLNYEIENRCTFTSDNVANVKRT